METLTFRVIWFNGFGEGNKLKMDKHKKKIFAISGSTRVNSSNEALLKLLLKLYSDVVDIEIYNQLDQLPHFNPDVSDDAVSGAVKDFRNKVDQADGVLICTPEYVFSLPGALKTALEWSVSTTVFTDKPFAFIVASGLGEKAYESLELIMNTILQYKIGDNAKLLIQGARAKLNSEGDVVDKKVLDDLRKVMDSLIMQINTKSTF
jgi:chromate reductase, NAD(P)H dehydrogenase (quinone)